MNRIRRAWIDAHIGWHQGAAERAERSAAQHRDQERRWRERYEARTGPTRSGAPSRQLHPPDAATPTQSLGSPGGRRG